tara:strand:+ start:267 stop:500 length:234 start_codon:yes stop_codon:yes gene_type:complete
MGTNAKGKRKYKSVLNFEFPVYLKKISARTNIKNPAKPTENVFITLFLFFKLDTSNKHVINETKGMYNGIPILLEIF